MHRVLCLLCCASPGSVISLEHELVKQLLSNVVIDKEKQSQDASSGRLSLALDQSRHTVSRIIDPNSAHPKLEKIKDTRTTGRGLVPPCKSRRHQTRRSKTEQNRTEQAGRRHDRSPAPGERRRPGSQRRAKQAVVLVCSGNVREG